MHAVDKSFSRDCHLHLAKTKRAARVRRYYKRMANRHLRRTMKQLLYVTMVQGNYDENYLIPKRFRPATGWDVI